MIGRASSPPARIGPGGRREIGLVNSLIGWVIGIAGGTGRAPNVFTTLARHRRLFRAWLRFASRLMPGGTLPRSDTELVILRVAHNCDCEYETHHHERLAAQAGLSAEQISAAQAERGTSGPPGPGFSERQALLLRAVDELHDQRVIADPTWQGLREFFADVQLIELCMLTGHYEMLAMTLNSLGVQPDSEPLGGGRVMPLVRLLRGASVLALVVIFAGAVPPLVRAAGLRDGFGVHVVSAHRLGPRLQTITVRSGALPSPANVRILSPAGYERTHRRYPVLYLLHGTSGAAADWTTIGDAERTTAGMPLIVVMPDIALGGDGGGWCTNWPDGRYRWETFHIDQLIPWVDRNLPTLTDRGHRAVAGLSQGGFCSMSYAARHPDLFSVALSFSGAPDIAYDEDARAGTTAIINATEVGLDHVPANSMFGDRATNEVNWAAHDPATLAENLRATKLFEYFGDGLAGPLDPPGVNLGASSIESAVHQDNIDFHNRLAGLGIPSVYAPYGNGTHTWPYWARDLRWSIGALMSDFAHPAPPPLRFTYTSADPAYAIYRWRVAMHRTARELATLSQADCHGFRLAGSGSATVLTAPCYRSRALYRVAMRGPHVAVVLRVRARRDRRLKIDVPLGPSNPYQQYTAQAQATGTSVYSTTVTVARVLRASRHRAVAKRR